MSRSPLLTVLVSLPLLAMALPLFAEETADIALGGGLVARIRDRGAFATVRERAANVDQALVEVVSTKDTLHPQVSLKQKGNLWTIYAWDIAVISVYPAEAKANGLAEKQLGAMWAANLKAQLPKATPCSKLPPEMLGYKPASATAKPVAALPPVKTGSAKPVAVVATTTAAKPPTAVISTVATRPVSTMVGNESGALLLIVDAMRVSRDLNDQEWTAKKEALAQSLYGDLSYYLTGKGVAPKLPTTVTIAKPAATTKPVTATTKPVVTTTKPVVTVKPTATKPVATTTKPATTGKPTASVVTPAANASTVKVPQKNRIRAKFTAAQAPYDKLAASDPAVAAQVSALLAASRQAFAYGNFDESEKQVDAALAALGVTYTGQ